jgi:hypothetical protein
MTAADDQRDDVVFRIGHALMLAGCDPTDDDAANVLAVIEAACWRIGAAQLRKRRATHKLI